MCAIYPNGREIYAEDVDLYSDASGNLRKGGFGAYFGTDWTAGQWDTTFMIEKRPSIEYLELFGLTVGVVLWIHNFRNRTVNLFCDNTSVTSVKDMVNNTTSSCKILHVVT